MSSDVQQHEAPPFQATNIRFSYGPISILNQMSLEARKGEIIGLVGPNGSGKTTFTRIVAGTLTPRSGTVQVQGIAVSGLKPRDRARLVAVVQQNPAVPPGMTALEVVLMGRNAHLGLLQWEGSKDIEVCRRVMELTDTWDFAHRLAPSLSGGEMQRVFIARALAQETPLLVLDEPTAHLDISYQAKVFDTIHKIRRETSITVLVAMHDLTLAGQYCDRIAALSQGRVIAFDAPSKVLTSDLIAEVFGAPVAIIEHPIHRTPVVLPVGEMVVSGGEYTE